MDSLTAGTITYILYFNLYYFLYISSSNFYGNQIVLYNSFIKIDNQPVFLGILKGNDAVRVRHFFNNDGKALDYNTFCVKYVFNVLGGAVVWAF